MWKAYRRKQFIPVTLKDNDKKLWQIDWVKDYANWLRDYASVTKLFPENTKKLKQLYDSISKHSNNDEFGEYIEFEYKNYQCRFYGVVEAGRMINGDISGVFFGEEYQFLNPEKSTIIDIGANIGDTAIYFCMNNAERVIALEPFSFPYNYANTNVDVNKMRNKIELLNAGYGKDSEVNVSDKKSGRDDILQISVDGNKIHTYSLRTLINMYGLNNKDNLLLKMDCEGCEYNLIDESINVLRKFRRIELEFHYGYKNMESKLEEAGFSVHHSKPFKSGCSYPSLKKMALINKDHTIGIIYAERHPI